MAGKRKQITWRVNVRGCFICTSHAVGTDGYPALWKDGRRQHAHRVLYEEKHGPLPIGCVARHKCDTRACINLDHVEPGTPAQNSADMKVRERCNTPRGENRSDAKLTLKQVRAIVESNGSQYVLAQRYGVNQSTISRIQSGKRWPDRKCA